MRGALTLALSVACVERPSCPRLTVTRLIQELLMGQSPEQPAAESGDLVATLHTSSGDVRVRLFPNHAPKTVRNFVELAEGAREWTDPRTRQQSRDPLYNGTVFHRVIPDFMIQGGDPLGTGTGGPGYQFQDEFHPELAFNKPYLLAMANAGPGTNGSQFFITVAPTAWLTNKHTIFGEVIDGTDVIDTIASTDTDGRDRPKKDVVLESVTVERGAG